MHKASTTPHNEGLGTGPVFFTAISTILGAILFLRFGFAVGTLGFFGALAILILGHLITIPTALAISELATNTRVEGGGEYFIISRSFGLKIGSTIGIALFFSQAISVAFYIIAFTEAFAPLFDMFKQYFGYDLPRQVISVPTLLLVGVLIFKKGADLGLKTLYIIVAILFLSLLFLFIGKPITSTDVFPTEFNNFGFFNGNEFFIVFAICFPAFTGMTAGVGLSGELKNPSRSIPYGTVLATFGGMVVYLFVIWKLAASAPQHELATDQLIMARIALGGALIIPIGLAASTMSSALGSILVAPRTLQALAFDNIFPLKQMNVFLAKEKKTGNRREPKNATLVSLAIAFVFILMGDVNAVAQIIAMFFLITYGTLCLISFLNHFGSPPSYRPKFKSRWYFSLGGFLLSVWVMFMINPGYTILAYIVISVIYLVIAYYNKDQKGVINIFQGALFQLNRKLQVYLQKSHAGKQAAEWRPSAICVSPHSFERPKVIDLMKWISYQHGFGTYFHFMEGYYSRQSNKDANATLAELIKLYNEEGSGLYIDTMISPSYTSAIAQVIQAPSISGMENNMAVFEFDKNHPEEINRIIQNINLTRAGDFDVCIYGTSNKQIRFKNGIHIWIRPTDIENTNLMILLGYIILAHPDWKKSYLKIFSICQPGMEQQTKDELQSLIETGRLPITFANIEIITAKEGQTTQNAIMHHSGNAGLTILGFREERVKHSGEEFFSSFADNGDLLFVNSTSIKEIK